MIEALSVLRSEFDAADGSFLLQLRCDLHWDQTAFARLTDAMLAYASGRDSSADIPRWLAEGFWYVDWFVREWSTHPSFPREHEQTYYEAAYERLHDLAYFLFVGESPYDDPSALETPV